MTDSHSSGSCEHPGGLSRLPADCHTYTECNADRVWVEKTCPSSAAVWDWTTLSCSKETPCFRKCCVLLVLYRWNQWGTIGLSPVRPPDIQIFKIFFLMCSDYDTRFLITSGSSCPSILPTVHPSVCLLIHPSEKFSNIDFDVQIQNNVRLFGITCPKCIKIIINSV